MDVLISSSNLKLSDSLRESAETRVSRFEKQLGGVDRAEIRFKEERNPRIAAKEVCELVVRRRGMVVRVRGSAQEPLAALDLVIQKAQHRVEKMRPHRRGLPRPREPVVLTP